MTVLVAQLGARRHYAVPRALFAHGLLHELVTDLCADAPPLSWMRALAPEAKLPTPLRRILGRRAPGISPACIHNLVAFALSPANSRRTGEPQTRHWVRRNAAFGQAVVKRGFGGARTVYAFNAAALEIFRAAKQQGLHCILDQTAAPWRYNTSLLREESRRWPGWETEPPEIDEGNLLSEREEAEWSLADTIVCGSDFAADALASTGGPRTKCVVVPYSGHASAPPGARESESDHNTDRKLRVLTVGSIQLRKGAPYLLDAARRLSDQVEFRWVGDNHLSEAATAEMRKQVDMPGSVPRSEIWRHYAWADIFILPTLSEGSANAVQEARAMGLPVITTRNAGARDAAEGRTTYVPARDSRALEEAIVGHLNVWRHSADLTAPSAVHHSTFSDYAERLANSIAILEQQAASCLVDGA